MSGSFRIEAAEGTSRPGAFYIDRSRNLQHDHVVFHLDYPGARGTTRVVFNDPRRFGFMLFADDPDRHPMLAGLGVEPTGNELGGPLLAGLFRGRKAPLKAALLDQRLIAGLGNIYASEALWRAGLSPRRQACTMAPAAGRSHQRASRLAAAIRSVIADAIEAGGSSLRDHAGADGRPGYFQYSFSVYDREGEACRRPGCSGRIRRIVQAGRSTFYCPGCQR
jgi:formamidopyrimidine-DNA glycosylase